MGSEVEMKTAEQNLQTELEAGILGMLLNSDNTKLLYSVIDRLEPRHFYFERNKRVYTAIVDTFVRENAVDVALIGYTLKDGGHLEGAGGVSYLADLISDEINPSTLYGRIDRLLELWKFRSLHAMYEQIKQKIEGEGLHDVDAAIAGLAEKLFALQYDQQHPIPDLARVADSVIRKAKELNEGGTSGYSWGIPKLDFYTGGVEPGKTYVIGGTKKTGKTKFVINTIFSLRKNRVKSFFFSLEMSTENVVRELLSRFANVNNYSFKRGVVEEQVVQLNAAAAQIREDILVDDSISLTPQQIRAKIRAWSRRGVEVFFVDYIQRIAHQAMKGVSMNWATIIGNTVRELADTAKAEGVALILLSQLRNEAEGEVAGIEHLKDSGGIAENVDCIMILNNQDRIQKRYENKLNEVWVDVEQRSGQQARVRCKVDLATASYHELTPQEKLI
jgi:replicative DNA helicase